MEIYDDDDICGSNACSTLKRNIFGNETHSEKNRVILVPWFSSNEWMEVHTNLFSNDSIRWKAAYCQMNVWKARFPNIAVGIESTIPLLHAMIAHSEREMEDSFKDSIINLAIIRFVSIASKGFGNSFKVKDDLHSLAKLMNIPAFLVGLRNGIIHHDNVSGSSSTLEAALESCVLWIRKYYWDKEYEFHKHKNNMRNESKLEQSKPSHVKDSLTQNIDVERSDDSDGEDASTLKETLEDECSDDSNDEEVIQGCTDSYTNIVRYLTFATRDLKKPRNGLISQLIKSLEKFYETSPKDCVELIVNELLCSKYITKKIYGFGCRENDGSFEMPKKYIVHFQPIAECLHNLQTLNEILFALIRKAEEIDYTPLCFAWIRYFALMCSDKSENRICWICREVHADIHWRKIIYELMGNAVEKHVKFALELSELVLEDPPKNRALNADERKFRILRTASKAFLCDEIEKKELEELEQLDGQKTKKRRKVNDITECPEEKNEVLEDEDYVMTMNDIIRDARKFSKKSFAYVKDLMSDTVDAPAEIEVLLSDMAAYSCTPLGILPHQLGDPEFYKKLILDIK